MNKTASCIYASFNTESKRRSQSTFFLFFFFLHLKTWVAVEWGKPPQSLEIVFFFFKLNITWLSKQAAPLRRESATVKYVRLALVYIENNGNCVPCKQLGTVLTTKIFSALSLPISAKFWMNNDTSSGQAMKNVKTQQLLHHHNLVCHW